MKRKARIMLLALLTLSIVLLIEILFGELTSPSTAQVCYYESSEGEFIDLTHMCVQEEEQEQEQEYRYVPAVQDPRLVEGEIAIQAVFDEVNEVCAGTACTTEADYKNEVRRLCSQPGRCPDYFLEEIETWED